MEIPILKINDFFNVITISGLITLGIIHFMVYSGRRYDKKERYNIYFGFFTIFLSFFIIVDTNLLNILNIFPSQKFLNFQHLFKVSFSIIFLINGFFLFAEIIGISKNIYIPSYILLSSSVFVIVISFFIIKKNTMELLFDIATGFIVLSNLIPMIISIIYIMKNKIYKNKIVINILFGMLIFIFYICSLKLMNSFLPNVKIEFNYFPIGLSILLFAYTLTNKFNQEHKDLIDLTSTLEQKVLSRTAELEEVTRQKTNFFINFAHETKTPLTVIKNFYDRYIEKKVKIDLDILGRNIDKLYENLTYFLTAEKMNTGSMTYHHKGQIVNFSELIKKNQIFFNDNAKSNGVNISYDITNNLYIESDKHALLTSVYNIIDNAIKYTDEKGKIKVSLKSKNDQIEFVVKDTGIGMNEEQLKNVFIPFYQIERKKDNRQGFGFGLYIVKNIVDSLYGQIFIESKLNEGTVFKVIFSSYELKESDKVEDILGPHFSYSIFKTELKSEIFDKNKETVFIVEDNKDVLYLIQDKLLDKYNVYYAFNGKEALEKLKSIPFPCLIISDIMMDTMDGMDFFKEIRDDEKYNKVPFMFLSAKSPDKLDGLGLGAVDFIEKPFYMPELLARVDSIMLFQKKQREKKKEIDINKCEKHNIKKLEIEIIKLIKDGLENKEIASCLGKTEGTIKTYIKIIFKKVDVKNRIDLINFLY